MRKIFDEYGRMLVVVIAVVALIAMIAFTMRPNGVLANAFETITQTFADKTTNLISGDGDGGSGGAGDYKYVDFVITSENREKVGYTGEENENLVIPASFKENGYCYTVVGIGDCAFQNCTNLTSIKIPAGVTSIDYNAFDNCSNLTNIVFEEDSQLTTIGVSAFEECTSLTSIEIPSGVTGLGGFAFQDCTNLTNVTIPETVTSIRNYTFRRCTNLTSITIPDSVTSIGNWAFGGCTNLTNVVFGNDSQLTSIGEAAFRECTSLANITLPDSLTSLAVAFYGCTNLTSINIPANLTHIPGQVFTNLPNLTSFIFENPNGWYVKYNEGSASVTDLSADDLSNAATAAIYLTSTYGYRYWYRSN